jgi:hypothetical protein
VDIINPVQPTGFTEIGNNIRIVDHPPIIHGGGGAGPGSTEKIDRPLKAIQVISGCFRAETYPSESVSSFGVRDSSSTFRLPKSSSSEVDSTPAEPEEFLLVIRLSPQVADST